MDTGMNGMAAWDLQGWSAGHLERVEQALSRWVGVDAPAGLGDAMRYAVLDGGKRLRPLLVLAARSSRTTCSAMTTDKGCVWVSAFSISCCASGARRACAS